MLRMLCGVDSGRVANGGLGAGTPARMRLPWVVMGVGAAGGVWLTEDHRHGGMGTVCRGTLELLRGYTK